MYCSECGSEVLEGAKFCNNCGAQLQVCTDEKDNKQTPMDILSNGLDTVKSKLRNIKTITIIGIFAVAVLCFIIYIFISGSSKPYTWSFHPISENPIEIKLKIEDTNMSYHKIYNKNGNIKSNIINSGTYTKSLDHSTAAYIADSYVLYYVNAQGNKQVEGNVINYILTDNGNGIAYQVDTGDKWILKYYEIGTDESKVIDQAIAIDDYDNRFRYRVSPNGDTVFYWKFESSSSYSAYVYQNGKSTRQLEGDVYPYAVSNKGDYLYYSLKDSDGLLAFYVTKEDDEIKLFDKKDYMLVTGFNSDYSECLFYDDGTYLYADGDVHKLFNNPYKDVCHPLYFCNIICNVNRDVWGIDTFKNKVLLDSEYNLFYIDGEYDSDRIASDVKSAIVSKDSKSLLYMDYDQEVYYIKDLKENANPDRILKDMDIDKIETNPNLTELYILTEDEKLYYKKESGKEKLLDRNVEDVAITSDGKTLYYLTDYMNGAGTLYYSEYGKKSVEIEDADNIYMLFRGETTINILKKYDNRDYINCFTINDEHELCSISLQIPANRLLP